MGTAPSARASRGSSSSSSHAPRQRAGLQDEGMAGVCVDLRGIRPATPECGKRGSAAAIKAGDAHEHCAGGAGGG